MDPDFNSSDVEMSPPKPLHPRAGKTSITEMLEHTLEDRTTSKKLLRSLQDVRGAPSSVYARQLWLNRFEEHARLSRTLIDPTAGATCDQLIRFLCTITDRIKPQEHSQSIPSLSTLQVGFVRLEAALAFKYKDFKLTRHDLGRVDAALDTLVSQGKLYRGLKHNKQWITVALLHKMARAWMTEALTGGCLSWEVVLLQLFTVVFQASLISRCGDVALTAGYTEEYMKWSQIRMVLRPEGDTLDHLDLEVTLCYEKFKKTNLKEDCTVLLRPLKDPLNNVICPVKLLLTLGLRSGNIPSGFLAQTSRRFDRQVQFTYPQRPVVPGRLLKAFVDWDRPSNTKQATVAVRDMSLVCGVLVPLSSHDLRRGGIADLTNLAGGKNNLKRAFADQEVAMHAGHSRASHFQGVTDKYAGPTEVDAYSLRAEEKPASRKEPLIGTPMPKGSATKWELDDYCSQNGVDPKDKKQRKNAAIMFKKQRISNWNHAQKNKTVPVTPSMPGNGFVSSSRSTPSSLSESPLFVPSTSSSSAVTTPSATTPSNLTSIEDALARVPQELHGRLDPAWIFDGVDVEVDEECVKGIYDVLLTNNDSTSKDADRTQREQDLAVDALLASTCIPNTDPQQDPQQDPCSKAARLLALTGNEFVRMFSSINVTRNFGAMTQSNVDLTKKCPTGGTRDEPTMFIFLCSKCHDYQTTRKYDLDGHEAICDPLERLRVKEAKNLRQFPCTHESCTRSFANAGALQTHIKCEHNFIPRTSALPHCTDPAEIFTSDTKWRNHQNLKHLRIKPQTCSVDGCTSPIVFTLHASYRTHLEKAHSLKSIKNWKPYAGEVEKTEDVEIQCPRCSTVRKFKSPGNLVNHLQGKDHGLTTMGAEKAIVGLPGVPYIAIFTDDAEDGDQ